MQRRSLRKRVEFAFVICFVWLSAVWGFAFVGAIRLSEDRVLTNQLRAAAEDYPDLPENPRVYGDVSRLPEKLRDWARTDPDAGLYEFVDEELHVAVISVESEQRRAFVVLDVAGLEASSSEDWWLLIAIIVFLIVVGSLGFWLGILFMRKAVEPVVQLASMVSTIDLEHLPPGNREVIEASRFDNDEVGVLAEAIKRAFDRVNAFIVRERYFTGWASHELRTPVTVMMGALELLEGSKLSDDDAQAVERAKRATVEMNMTIEMFLSLVREKDVQSSNELFFVAPLVKQAIEQQQHLLTGKLIDVYVDGVDQAKAYGNPRAFLITLNNLVRNAFEHAPPGQVSIKVNIKDGELLITNNIGGSPVGEKPPTESSSFHGYGLGLVIVQRLCSLNGWSFSLRLDDAHATACLSW